ncbi:MAG: AraC family transcriptional regulator [Rhodobacterales bacterium]|nr:MAG: AraC family transcriptional regulator [Rhodobacterales bacterium]
MQEPVCWRRLTDFVPGRVDLCSDALDWKNVALRSYQYEGQDVIVPAMRDFLLVGYRAGITPMQRRFDGRWSRETLFPGAASFLTRAQTAHWTWKETVDVTHIYLSADLMTEVACEMFDRPVEDVKLQDVLRTTDPVVTHAMAMLAGETKSQGMGGALYVDALSRGLVIHLLRHYATIRMRKAPSVGQLSPLQKRRITRFIADHLDQQLNLSTLAAGLSITPCLFARHFKSSFGQPPYAYVMAQRLERAKVLLRRSDLPIKQVAADCGFSDQAHLTRLFGRAYGAPPARYRREHA